MSKGETRSLSFRVGSGDRTRFERLRGVHAKLVCEDAATPEFISYMLDAAEQELRSLAKQQNTPWREVIAERDKEADGKLRSGGPMDTSPDYF